jgi:hypothetical protein
VKKLFKLFTWLVAAIGLLAMLIGCATTTLPPASDTSATSPDQADDRVQSTTLPFPPGTYLASIRAEDYFEIPNYSSTKFETFLVGDWKITFDEEHHYGATRNGNFLAAEGNYTITEDEIVFTDEGGPWACLSPNEENGVYKWAFDGQTLALTAVEDQCPGRTYAFTSRPFSIQN